MRVFASTMEMYVDVFLCVVYKTQSQHNSYYEDGTFLENEEKVTK